MPIFKIQHANAHILYDAERFCGSAVPLDAPARVEALFDTSFWEAREGIVASAPGRGESLFVAPHELSATSDAEWVLRHYRRGGAIAHVASKRYAWTGVERTRAFREMRLTAGLKERGLAVPAPVGACVWRHQLSYEAAFISVRIPGARPLASLLNEIDTTVLEQVGRLIRDAHDLGLDHVDLNARNILIDHKGKAFIIDLDRCRLRDQGRWQEANLARLGRSLEKFAPGNAPSLLETITRSYHETTSLR